VLKSLTMGKNCVIMLETVKKGEYERTKKITRESRKAQGVSLR